MKRLGFERVYNLSTGLLAWREPLAYGEEQS